MFENHTPNSQAAMPPRIAYLTSVYPRASDTFIRIEVLELRRLGFEVHTFSVNRPPADQMVSDEIRSEQRQTGYLLSAGVLRLIGAGLLAMARSPRRMPGALALAVRTSGPGPRGWIRQVAYLLEASLLARRMRDAGVQHLHNHISENSAHVAMFASQISGVPFSLTVHGPGIFFHPRRWALGEKIARSAFTACISHFCRSQCMIFADPASWPRLHIVRCAVNRSFASADHCPVPNSPTLVCVGRLCPEKGQWLLVEAARCLALTGLKLQIDLIGDGPMRPALEKKIAEHGLHEHVRLLGWLGSEQVHERLLRARALIVASFAEGLPVVIMEAMAAGRPVLATRIAAIGELVEDGVSGWLVPPGSVEALCDAIRSITAEDPQRLDEMGRAGAARVGQQHDVTTEVDRLADLFRRSAAGLSCGAVRGNNPTPPPQPPQPPAPPGGTPGM